MDKGNNNRERFTAALCFDIHWFFDDWAEKNCIFSCILNWQKTLTLVLSFYVLAVTTSQNTFRFHALCNSLSQLGQQISQFTVHVAFHCPLCFSIHCPFCFYRYTYLFKGLEDLHLDERITQFLEICNHMFAKEEK